MTYLEYNFKDAEVAAGRTITSIEMKRSGVRDAEELSIRFGRGVLTVWDDAQSCCEHRYMRTDDDLEYFVGATFVGLELRDTGKEGDEEGDDVHDIQFLLVHTSKGDITICSHNVHNGYYGGFNIITEAAGFQAY